MPCRDDWPTPSAHNRYLQRTAQLLIYVRDKLGTKITDEIFEAAKDEFCNRDLVPVLCADLKLLKKKELDRIVYNARDARSRDLADWWEAHQEADKKRKAKEEQEERDEELRLSAMKKLTKEEIRALGLKK